MFHYRESRGTEIDLIVEQGERLHAIEVKSGSTVTTQFFRNLERFRDRLQDHPDGKRLRLHLIYGGDASQKRASAHLHAWHDLPSVIA